jgi:NAD(P)-dependent dehydrogenase (short-subunit alcohol dehydrogenase family)
MYALVIGAQPSSLGWHVAEEFERVGWDVMTAGISGHEDAELDITQVVDVAKFFINDEPFNAVVNTAGVNEPFPTEGVGLAHKLEDHFLVNVVSHVMVLQHWLAKLPETVAYWTNHYVSISSNSANIARSNSMPYCTTKAALSMAVRCAARDQAGKASIYAYEPGLLDGTPMTEQVRQELGQPFFNDKGPVMHRMRGGKELDHGIRPGRLARVIVNNVRIGGPELNGSIIRLDGGEQ